MHSSHSRIIKKILKTTPIAVCGLGVTAAGTRQQKKLSDEITKIFSVFLKNIPKGVNKRLSEISANQEVFDLATPLYQAELDRCGYKYQLKYSPPEPPREKRKKK